MKCSDSWSKALGKPLVEDLGPPDFEWLRRSYSLFSGPLIEGIRFIFWTDVAGKGLGAWTACYLDVP